MIGVGIGVVAVTMAVPVTVAMSMVVAVIVAVPVIAAVAAADALDMMVVAFLGQADLGLEADDVLPVLAQLAVHQVLSPVQDLLDPLGEGVEHQLDGRRGRAP